MAKMTALQVLKDAAELKELKSKDYQGSLFTEEDYFPFADASYIHMPVSYTHLTLPTIYSV